MIEDIYIAGLCSGCGTCEGLCDGAIQLRNNATGLYEPVVDKSRCNLCGLCLDVCPKYPQDFVKMNKFVFKRAPEDSFLGSAISFYVGQTLDKEILLKSSAGGITTTLLIFALQEGIIDGAIVARMGESNPLEPEIIIARTEKEIRSASGPLFCPVPLNIKIKDVLNENGKFAFVGLPCHIQGLRKAQMFNAQLKKKVVLCIGNFCCHNVSFLGTSFLLRRLNISQKDIVQINYRARRNSGGLGGFSVKTKNNEEFFIKHSHYWSPFGAFFFTPTYCMLCPDQTNEFADISVGNAWMLRNQLNGEHTKHSIVISRTEIGEKILKSVRLKGKIILTRINRDLVVRSQQEDLLFKKRNFGIRIRLLKALGKDIPPYSDRVQTNLISYFVSLLVHFNSNAFSNHILQRLLERIPFSLFRTYQLALYGLLKLRSRAREEAILQQ